MRSYLLQVSYTRKLEPSSYNQRAKNERRNSKVSLFNCQTDKALKLLPNLGTYKLENALVHVESY